MKKTFAIFLTLCLAFGYSSLLKAQQTLAFPGAEGFGRYALGARGVASPQVYHVTNLNDAGAGSFRDAVSQPGRIVVFDVCGVIKLSSRISFSGNSYIAGHTAPGDGVILYGNGVSFAGANNLIVRYLRIYMGKGGESGKDASGVSNGAGMIFDHLSIAWGLDENFSVNWDSKGTEPADITIQHSIIGQGIMTHSAGGLIQTNGGVSIIGCLYVDNSTRNPKVKGLNQYINNVVYNWAGSDGYILGDSDGASWAWLEGNCFIAGPNSGASPFTRANTNFQIYHSNDYVDGDKDGALNGAIAADANYGNASFKASRGDFTGIPKAHPEIAGGILSPQEALDRVVGSVGASLPARSAVDAYMLDELLSYGQKGALITNETNNGIYGNVGVVSAGAKPLDTDGDGMTDAWEDANGLDKNSAADATQPAANGYLNIENYINSIAAPVAPYVRCASDVKMTARTMSSISLSWKNNATESDGVTLQQSTDGASYADVQTLAATATSFDVTGLQKDQAYYFRLITAKSGLENSTPSEVLKVSTEGEPKLPEQSLVPTPAVGATSRFYTSVDFAWQNETGPWAGAVSYDVYFGASADNLAKVNADLLTEPAYTHVAAMTMSSTYYWRVDATNELGTTQGTVWSFRTGTYSFTTDYVDIGKDFDGSNTVNAASGALLTSGTKNYTVFAGTSKEMTFTVSGGTVNQSNGSYKAGTDIQYFDLSNDAYYVEVSLTTNSTAKNIASIKVNGTGSDVDPAKGTVTPAILFSDQIPFSANSIIGYETVELPQARAGRVSTTTAAPVGSKSFRIYRKVTVSTVGEDLYQIGGSTNPIALGSAPSNSRIPYVAATLELLSNDGDREPSSVKTITSLTINGATATINQAEGTASCTFPKSTGALGTWVVELTLGDQYAVASFTGGNTHNFAAGPLQIEVTAEDGSKKTYTVSASVSDKKRVGLLTVDGQKAAYDDLFVSAFDDFDIAYLNAAGSTPADIAAYYQEYDLVVLHANVAGTNPIGLATRSLVGVKPIMSMKAFFYQNGRWGWASVASGNAGVGEITATVPLAVQNHPIFDGVTFDGDDGTTLTYYAAPTTVTNGVQYATTLDGENWTSQLADASHALATKNDGTQLHEVNLNSAAKYIMLGLSMEGDSYTLFNGNTVTLLRNAAAYLTNPYLSYDYTTNTPHSSDNTIATLTVNDVAAQLVQNTDTLRCAMPSSVSDLGTWAVAFTLSDPNATASFTSGATHDFAAGLLQITVTATDGSERNYTVVAAVESTGDGDGDGDEDEDEDEEGDGDEDDNSTGVKPNAISALKYVRGFVVNPTGGEVRIYSISGVLLLKSSKSQIEARHLQRGIYIARPQKGAALKFINN
ncbi:MAG: fibronectin type III domain-containing protein [Prevotellaceae bacterium]|jgi:hypothetical protein|nr:fibronectin type III domain-containing protein [Prevotellaceae bacterium]